jgi:hypothetical protein
MLKACGDSDNLNRLASILVEHLTPDHEDVNFISHAADGKDAVNHLESLPNSKVNFFSLCLLIANRNLHLHNKLKTTVF